MANTEKFEMIAHMYDTAERICIAQAASNVIREYLRDSKSKAAIDFGCGTGLVGMNLIDDFYAVRFLDTSQRMIHQVERKIDERSIQNANTLCFDFEKEDAIDLHADVIFMAQVLLHIPNVQVVLLRLFDVLNDEGLMMIVDFVRNEHVNSDHVHPGFDRDELIQCMRSIGYINLQFQIFLTGKKIFMGQDASMFILVAQKPKQSDLI